MIVENRKRRKEVQTLSIVQWHDRFNIGVENVDRQHRRLFSIIDKLLDLNEDESKQQHACREGVKYLKSYTLKHFADEEDYMQSIGYEGYAMHKRLHDNMRDNTLPALERELEEENYSQESVHHFLGICVGWLNGHIMIEDRAIAGKTSNKWIHSKSDDELKSLEKAVCQALLHLYRVRAELVSQHYSGEDFSAGTALCYRLSYRDQNDKPLQVFFLYEEKMILGVLSGMLGKPVDRIDKTVVYAIKSISQRFMDCVSSHFELPDQYRLQKVDMLTFEQLVRNFDKEYPPYSLLFNIEQKGYFGFCVK